MVASSMNRSFDGMTMIGVEFLDIRSQQAEVFAEATRSAQASGGDWQADAVASPVQLPMVPVFADAFGQHFVGQLTPLGMVLVPKADLRRAIDPESDDLSRGGFVELERLQQAAMHSPAGSTTCDDANLIAGATLRVMTSTAPTKFPVTHGDRNSGSPSYGSDMSLGNENGNASESFPNTTTTGHLAPPQSNGPHPLLSGLQQQVLSQVLANVAVGNDSGAVISQTLTNLPNLGMMAVGQLIGSQVQKLFAKWEVDDESSTAEHVAKQAAQEVVGKIQSEVMSQVAGRVLSGGKVPDAISKRMTEFFTGVSSSATLAAAHDLDPDNICDTVKASAASDVLVNGRVPAAAVSNDVLVPSQKRIIDGSSTVFLCKGLNYFSRGTSETMVPSILLPPCPANVLIGGTSLSCVAKQTAIDALGQGASVAQAATKTQTAQNAYDAAIRAGLTPEQAGRRALAAVKRSELTPEQLKELVKREDKLQERVKENDGVELKEGDRINIGTEDNPDWVTVEKVHRDEFGYMSVLFNDTEHSPGHFPLVFRATESDDTFVNAPYEFFKDWGQNVAQVFGFVPGQYAFAVQDATTLMADYPTLVLVGHSLGGGMAAYAGGMTGLPVVTMNGAGLGAGTMGNIVATGNVLDPTQVDHFNVENDIVTAYANAVTHPQAGEIHTLQTPQPGNVIPGQQGFTVGPSGSGPYESHGINTHQYALEQPEVRSQMSAAAYTPVP